MKVPFVKICGLTRVEDARTATEAGADYLGAILSPGFARSVPAELAAGFTSPDGLPLVGVFVDASLKELVGAVRVSGARLLQLHGAESPDYVREVRGHGDWPVWKAVRVRSADDVIEALERFAPVVDGLLLDGWHRERGGGAGIAFPWEVVEPVRHTLPPKLTFVAAGGLEPDNVAEAVARLRPDVVDVSSGVELRRGIKDGEKVRAFVRNAKGRTGS